MTAICLQEKTQTFHRKPYGSFSQVWLKLVSVVSYENLRVFKWTVDTS